MKKATEKFLAKYPDLPAAIRDLSALAPDYEVKRNEFKEFYATTYPILLAAEKTIRNLLQLLISDLSIDAPKVISRIKDRDSAIEKFELKYRDRLEREGSDYEISTHITDLIGIRIICLYERDIESVAELVRREFDVVGETDKTASLLKDVKVFGYKGLHFDAKLNGARAQYSEYKKISGRQFEIQIRTIAQDAWSEIDHKLKYKRQTTPMLQRRITRLSALFELVDQEFVAIRDETDQLERQASSALSSPKTKTDDSIVDAFIFLAFMQSRYPRYFFDPVRIDGFVDEVIALQPGLTSGELYKAVDTTQDVVLAYKSFRVENGYKMNPFTEMRYCLYVFKPSFFDLLIYSNQKNDFLRWYEDNNNLTKANSRS